MVSTPFGEKNRASTTVQTVPGTSILEPSREMLKQVPKDSANLPNQAAILSQRCTEDQTNIFRRSLASHTARRLFILFDVVFTILLIVLLGDGEDDLRLHPAFVTSSTGLA